MTTVYCQKRRAQLNRQERDMWPVMHVSSKLKQAAVCGGGDDKKKSKRKEKKITIIVDV